DILKDRLYTTGQDSLARRSAQTALFDITQALLKLMAPILSFTTEEAWKDLHPGKAVSSIFTELFQVLSSPADSPALIEKWQRLRAIRAEVMRKIEDLRAT